MASGELPDLEKSDIDEIMKDVEKKKQEEIADLESRSKQLYELVVTENFAVDEVIGYSNTTSITPRSGRVFGEAPPTYSGGYKSKLVLEVTPDNESIPVKTLIFDGHSIVKAGDYISAQIPRYEEKKIRPGFFNEPRLTKSKTVYIDRDFKEEESAIELTILSEDGKVLRRDRAVNYKTFVNE